MCALLCCSAGLGQSSSGISSAVHQGTQHIADVLYVAGHSSGPCEWPHILLLSNAGPRLIALTGVHHRVHRQACMHACYNVGHWPLWHIGKSKRGKDNRTRMHLENPQCPSRYTVYMYTVMTQIHHTKDDRLLTSSVQECNHSHSCSMHCARHMRLVAVARARGYLSRSLMYTSAGDIRTLNSRP